MTKKQKEKVIVHLEGLKKFWRNGKGWLQVSYSDVAAQDRPCGCVLAGLDHVITGSVSSTGMIPYEIATKTRALIALTESLPDSCPRTGSEYDVVKFNDYYATSFAEVRNVVTKTIKRLRKEIAPRVYA